MGQPWASERELERQVLELRLATDDSPLASRDCCGIKYNYVYIQCFALHCINTCGDCKCAYHLSILAEIASAPTTYLVSSLRNWMRLARSGSFFMPANTIFVPGMYFLGARRNSERLSADHSTGLSFIGAE